MTETKTGLSDGIFESGGGKKVFFRVQSAEWWCCRCSVTYYKSRVWKRSIIIHLQLPELTDDCFPLLLQREFATLREERTRSVPLVIMIIPRNTNDEMGCGSSCLFLLQSLY